MTDKRYSGVIFDFNGVLLWDNYLHEEAWRLFSSRLRGHPLTMDEMRLAVHGRVNRDIFEYILNRPISDDELRPLAEEKETLYRQLAIETGDAYQLSPGAAELLDCLAANDIPRAIATSSPEVNVTFFIERLDLLRWFAPEHIIFDRGLYPGKPAPGIYLEAAAALEGRRRSISSSRTPSPASSQPMTRASARLSLSTRPGITTCWPRCPASGG